MEKIESLAKKLFLEIQRNGWNLEEEIVHDIARLIITWNLLVGEIDKMLFSSVGDVMCGSRKVQTLDCIKIHTKKAENDKRWKSLK